MSTASLVVGVAAAHSTASDILVAGVAGLVAGAMSMAAGEYVSVSSQSDTEKADLERERKELATEDESFACLPIVKLQQKPECLAFCGLSKFWKEQCRTAIEVVW